MSTKQLKRPLITIGHGAYPRGSENSLRITRSKSEAVNVLRQRGFTRDQARHAVTNAITNGAACARSTFDLCEVRDDTARAYAEQWPTLALKRAQREAFDRYVVAQ